MGTALASRMRGVFTAVVVLFTFGAGACDRPPPAVDAPQGHAPDAPQSSEPPTVAAADPPVTRPQSEPGPVHPKAGTMFWERHKLADGTTMEYAVALPEGYRQGEPRRVLLALPPGPQTRGMVDVGMEAYWAKPGTARGMVVVSPIAPGGTLFFRGNEPALERFIAHVRETYPVDGGRLDLAGISNGGLSAFRIVLRQPSWFRSLVVIPGMPPTGPEMKQLDRLADIDVQMYVGEHDGRWRTKMTKVAETLRSQGHPRVHFEVVAGAGHQIRALEGERAAVMFDRLLGKS